ncbi:hypothetical protein [Rhizobium sp. BK176]|uniref:hypothetical protein n=1 Tax=Rhizobium sp. BK176 TaxID=2587071 RepID=UPI0021676873|nr:hypothetical protein [Rhizobium sp. BK176]MCS4088658.1 hypothetical protein [Rhizobium sp. BK176]
MDYMHDSPSYIMRGPKRDEAIKNLSNEDLIGELVVAAEFSDYSSSFEYREDLRLEALRRLNGKSG